MSRRERGEAAERQMTEILREQGWPTERRGDGMTHPNQAAKIEHFKMLCAALESARIAFTAYDSKYNDPSVTIPLKGDDLLEVVAMAGDAVRLYLSTVDGVEPPRPLGTLTDLGDVMVLVKARIDRSFA